MKYLDKKNITNRAFIIVMIAYIVVIIGFLIINIVKDAKIEKLKTELTNERIRAAVNYSNGFKDALNQKNK